MAKHTPGPWVLWIDDHEQRYEIGHQSEDSEPGVLAHVYAADEADMYGEARRNAQLITVAPEMYALLENLHTDLARYAKMTEEVWSSGSIAFDSMATDISRVLAKARGETDG